MLSKSRNTKKEQPRKRRDGQYTYHTRPLRKLGKIYLLKQGEDWKYSPIEETGWKTVGLFDTYRNL